MGKKEVTDSDLEVMLPALDLYIEHLNQLAGMAKQTAPTLREAAKRAQALKDKLLVEDTYE